MSVALRLFALALLLLTVACGRKSDAPAGADAAPVDISASQWVAGSGLGPLDLLAIDFVDAQHGWAVGDIGPRGESGAIFYTGDGGQSWRAIARPTEVLAGVHFVSPQRGWAVGYAGRIERTDDGGQTWARQRGEREGEVFNSVCFLDAQHGWVAGGNGLLLGTANGGETWEPAQTGRVEDLWAVRFASAERGWAVGEDGLILATTDGGRTWARQESGLTRGLYGLAVAPAGALVAVGEKGTILRSEDGATWAATRSPTEETLNAVAAAGNVFWAVGSNGATVGSGDGGRTWTVAKGSQRNLLAIDLTGPTGGVAVGRRGAIQMLK